MRGQILESPIEMAGHPCNSARYLAACDAYWLIDIAVVVLVVGRWKHLKSGRQRTRRLVGAFLAPPLSLSVRRCRQRYAVTSRSLSSIIFSLNVCAVGQRMSSVERQFTAVNCLANYLLLMTF